MIWLPWNHKKKIVKADVARAKLALDESTATAPRIYDLAEELTRLREQNNFTMRLRLALQAEEDRE